MLSSPALIAGLSNFSAQVSVGPVLLASAVIFGVVRRWSPGH
jgi:hypothetical protein